VPFVLRYPYRLAATIILLLVSAISGLSLPIFGGQIVDAGFVTRNLSGVADWGWIIIGVAFVMAVASAGRAYYISVLGERVLTDLRKSVFDHLLSLDATFYDTHRVGELTARLNGDVAAVRGIIGSMISTVLRSAIQLVGSLVLMFVTSPKLAIAVIILVPGLILPIRLMGRRLHHISRQTQDTLADMSAISTEVLGAMRTIKSFVQEPEQSRQYSSRAERSYAAETSQIRIRAIMGSSVNFISTVILVALVWWGSREITSGEVTVGQLTQFLIYALMATGSVQGVSDVMGTLSTISGATERLMEILDTKSRLVVRPDPVPFPSPQEGRVEFDDVSFAYLARAHDDIVSHLSFTVSPGETVALVGHSGAGKSTIFSLVQRFYDVRLGRILIDGVDVRDADIYSVRRSFSYVEQEPTIFAGSIRDNIRFGRIDATDAEIEAAAKAALVHDFVARLEQGYSALVGERGIMLSGGQKQRLAIARALLKNAPVLLLDEATSALDAESEHLVQIALKRLMQGRSTLVIAHRLATIRDADRILVLDKGKLVDQGTHDELVERGGRYAELAKLQFRSDSTQAAE
jgi:ATP-binding cassette subfamily B protein